MQMSLCVDCGSKSVVGAFVAIDCISCLHGGIPFVPTGSLSRLSLR